MITSTALRTFSTTSQPRTSESSSIHITTTFDRTTQGSTSDPEFVSTDGDISNTTEDAEVEDSLDYGLIIGLVVAIVVVIGLIVFLVIICVRRMKTNSVKRNGSGLPPPIEMINELESHSNQMLNPESVSEGEQNEGFDTSSAPKTPKISIDIEVDRVQYTPQPTADTQVPIAQTSDRSPEPHYKYVADGPRNVSMYRNSEGTEEIYDVPPDTCNYPRQNHNNHPKPPKEPVYRNIHIPPPRPVQQNKNIGYVNMPSNPIPSDTSQHLEYEANVSYPPKLSSDSISSEGPDYENAGPNAHYVNKEMLQQQITAHNEQNIHDSNNEITNEPHYINAKRFGSHYDSKSPVLPPKKRKDRLPHSMQSMMEDSEWSANRVS